MIIGFHFGTFMANPHAIVTQMIAQRVNDLIIQKGTRICARCELQPSFHFLVKSRSVVTF